MGATKIISTAALVLMTIFSLVLVVYNAGGLKDTCNAMVANGEPIPITYAGCQAGFKKMARLGPTESALVSIALLIQPLFEAWFLAAGLGALYSLFVLGAGSKSVAVVHLIHAVFMLTACMIHGKTSGVFSALADVWPVDPIIDGPVRGMLVPWAGMTGFIGTTCLVAFVLTSGASDKTKSE